MTLEASADVTYERIVNVCSC